MSEAVCKMDYIISRDQQNDLKREEEAAVSRAAGYLRRYAALNQRIEQKLRFQDQLRSLAARAAGGFLPRPGAGGEDRRSAAAQRMAELERDIDQDIDHLTHLKNEIWGVLALIENPEAALILDDIYLCGSTIQKAADRSGFSLRHTYKLRRWGLLQVDRILREQRPMRCYVSPLSQGDGPR